MTEDQAEKQDILDLKKENLAGNIYRFLFIGYIKEGKEGKFMINITNDCQLQEDGDIQHVRV